MCLQCHSCLTDDHVYQDLIDIDNKNFDTNIFGKMNSPCPKCSKPIIKNFVGQRGTHYCRKCQRY